MSLLKIATFNANSVRIRLDQIIKWLGREKPDVLCLQETKVQDQDFPADAFRRSGYHVIFRGQKSHAGVALVSRAEPEAAAFGLDDGGEPDEARLIRARAALEEVRTWGWEDVFRRLHPGEPGQYTFWDYRFPHTVERNVGWRVDHIWATSTLAGKAVRSWIDVEARRAERPSDHTFLAAEFRCPSRLTVPSAG